MAQRMIEVREHIQLLAYGYIWEKDHILKNIGLIVLIPCVLFVNYRFALIDDTFLISIVIVVASFLGRTKNDALLVHDGVGLPANGSR